MLYNNILLYIISENNSKLRDVEDSNEIKSREIIRKTRLDTEDEYREKMRVQERRNQEENENIRVEMTLLKRYDI